MEAASRTVCGFCSRSSTRCPLQLVPSAPACASRRRTGRTTLLTAIRKACSTASPRHCLAYLHVIEGDTGGAAVPPFDYLAIKRPFGGPLMANNGFDKVRANAAIAQGRADLVAFGKPFISNPDLVTRLYLDVPLAPANRETFYGGADQGYTDYPLLRGVEPHACYCDDAERAWGCWGVSG